MKPLYCLLLLIFPFFTTCAQSEYISDMPLNNLEILDDEVSGYQVFFTGENHYYTSENNNIKLKMMKYLNKKAGVRNLVLELGYSRGFMLDRFINDDSSYYELMQHTTSVYYLEMYKGLRALNQSLDADSRIRVHGIDVERFADDGPILLAKLLPKGKEVPASISFAIEVIRSYGAYSIKKYKSISDLDQKSTINVERYLSQGGFFDAKTIDTMIADYERSKTVYMEYLGADFAVFDKVFKSIEEFRKYSEYSNMPHQYVYRERKIYDNLTTLMAMNPDQKYYGQFGRCHVSQTELNQQCNWWAFSSVAKRLNEGSAQDKVMSIGIFYNEKKLNKYYTESYFDDEATTAELKKYMDIPCSNSNTLTRINRKDTGLVKHYQYIIYSNPCEIKGKKSMYGRTASNDFHEWARMLDLGMGIATFDLGNLNAALLTGANTFDQQMMFYSFGISNNDFGFYTNSNYRFMSKQKVSSGPVNYTLGGFSITQSLGYMPSIQKRLAFGFYGSLGFNSLRLGVQNDSVSLPFSRGFSSVNSVKYVNNGFVIGGGLDLRYAVARWFGLFLRGNYLLDVSNKSWKYAIGNTSFRDDKSPKTSVGYYGVNAGISFLIQQ